MSLLRYHFLEMLALPFRLIQAGFARSRAATHAIVDAFRNVENNGAQCVCNSGSVDFASAVERVNSFGNWKMTATGSCFRAEPAEHYDARYRKMAIEASP